jgi:hypothetical protein
MILAISSSQRANTEMRCLLDERVARAVAELKRAGPDASSAVLDELLKDCDLGWRVLMLAKLIPKSFDWSEHELAASRSNVEGMRSVLKAIRFEGIHERIVITFTLTDIETPSMRHRVASLDVGLAEYRSG